MAKFKLELELVVEASTDEDAVAKVADYLNTCARRLGNEHTLEEIGALFTIAEAPADEPAHDLTDKLPVIDLTPEPEPAPEGEQQTITSADVGTVEDILGVQK